MLNLGQINAMKKIYVFLIRLAKTVAERFGLLAYLEKKSTRDCALWFRSLFSIYAIEDLIHLDLPWWSIKAVRVVDSLLNTKPKTTVFEYGSGASTVWLAKRVAKVFSVDHDRDWFNTLQSYIPSDSRAEIRLISPQPIQTQRTTIRSQKPGWENSDFSEYVNEIKKMNMTFGVIVIDGRCRAECLVTAIPFLEEHGFIIFDNSHRTRYTEAIKNSGLYPLTLRGLTVGLPYPDQTTLLFKSRIEYDRAKKIAIELGYTV